MMVSDTTIEKTTLEIKSEQDAWVFFEQAVSGEVFPDNIHIVFNGWPTFALDVRGKDWDSTVPSRVMAPLLQVQQDINRAYASVKYRELSLRKIKDDERDDLEIVLKVEKGSSLFSAELWTQLSRVAEAAFGHMNGTEAVTTILGLALAIAAPVMFKAWLKARSEEKALDKDVQLSEQETKRLEIFAKAMTTHPAIEAIRDEVQATNNRLMKALKPGDDVRIAGVELRSDQTEVLVQPERERAVDAFVEGLFTILGNRTDKSEGFRITVKRISDSLTLNADVPVELEQEQKDLIQSAEWSKRPIKLWITASMLRGAFTNAVIGSAEKPTEAELDAIRNRPVAPDD